LVRWHCGLSLPIRVEGFLVKYPRVTFIIRVLKSLYPPRLSHSDKPMSTDGDIMRGFFQAKPTAFYAFKVGCHSSTLCSALTPCRERCSLMLHRSRHGCMILLSSLLFSYFFFVGQCILVKLQCPSQFSVRRNGPYYAYRSIPCASSMPNSM